MKPAAIRTNILRALKHMGNNAMTRESLDNTLMLVDRNLLGGDIAAALADLQTDRYVIGVHDDLTDTDNYSLTIEGRTAAARL